jgi:hypothetical protein
MIIPGHTEYCKRLANTRKVLDMLPQGTPSRTAAIMVEYAGKPCRYWVFIATTVWYCAPDRATAGSTEG